MYCRDTVSWVLFCAVSVDGDKVITCLPNTSWFAKSLLNSALKIPCSPIRNCGVIVKLLSVASSFPSSHDPLLVTLPNDNLEPSLSLKYSPLKAIEALSE